MNHSLIGISFIGIEATAVSTVYLYLLCLRLFPPRSTSNFYWNFKKKIFFTSTFIGKCHKCLERNLIYFFLAQFHSKKTMSQSRALILNIEGAVDHSCLINCSGAKYKIFTVTFLIFNRIIFLYLWWLSTACCHTQIRRGSPIVDPTVAVQSRKTELVLITIQYNNIIII